MLGTSGDEAGVGRELPASRYNHSDGSYRTTGWQGRRVGTLSDKQRDFILKLRAETGVEENATTMAFINDLSKAEASDLIGGLIERSRAARKAERVQAAESKRQAAPKLELGIYRHADGRIIKVQQSRQGNGLYGKVLDVENRVYVYTPGALRGLTPDMQLTLDEAKELGRETGICCQCGAELTDPNSVASGIGPICGSGGRWRKVG